MVRSYESLREISADRVRLKEDSDDDDDLEDIGDNRSNNYRAGDGQPARVLR